MNETFKLKGRVKIQVIRNGEVVAEREVNNLVVSAGKNQVAKLLVGTDNNAFKYIAIGTGTTSPTDNDTALENEYARQQATVSTNNNVAQLEATFNISSTVSISESGVFNSDTDGVMLARTTFAPLNLQNGDTLRVTWKITIS